VPYKGGGEDALAVLSGFADMEFGSVWDVAANIRAGKMRPLGVTSAQRLKQLPEVRRRSASSPGSSSTVSIGGKDGASDRVTMIFASTCPSVAPTSSLARTQTGCVAEAEQEPQPLGGRG
jgi:hypothetical protein